MECDKESNFTNNLSNSDGNKEATWHSEANCLNVSTLLVSITIQSPYHTTFLEATFHDHNLLSIAPEKVGSGP